MGKLPLTEGQRRQVEDLRSNLRQLKKRFVRGEGRTSAEAAKKLQEQVASVVKQITSAAYEIIGADPRRRAKVDAIGRKLQRFSSKLPFPKSKSMRAAPKKR